MHETIKNYPRRNLCGFFDKYCKGKGIDIGCADSPITQNCTLYDISLNPSQDAQTMLDILDESYDWVYSSHCLEHMSSLQ